MELIITAVGAEAALEKVNRLVDLLKEAKVLIKEINEMNVDICINGTPCFTEQSFPQLQGEEQDVLI